VTRSPIASSVTVVNYNAAEEMRKGVPEQSQCGALFTSIASHVIHSSHLDGDYAVHVLYFIIITKALLRPRILLSRPPPTLFLSIYIYIYLSIYLSISLSLFRSFLSVCIFCLRRLAGGIIPLRTGNCSCAESTIYFLSSSSIAGRTRFFFMETCPSGLRVLLHCDVWRPT